ncbi:nuclear transport factor 2 family protein [Streptomyces carpinensis]|uniref:Nuclear transport factor 2 family protein n=1 Tax=Streptomyces carpinensis TaxID=66369 RepID=A0ABV1VV61_9ACTN|nr:nuclear transport factor 2 family protein [Streptomyces carpinensis]
MTTTQASDLEQIRRLNHEYAWAIDNFRLDDLLTFFTRDGVFDMRPLGAPEAVAGTDALRKMFAGMIDEMDGCIHLMMNHLVDLAGDRATGRVYCHSFSLMPDGTKPEVFVCYEDSYARTNGKWQFTSRTVTPLLTTDR